MSLRKDILDLDCDTLLPQCPSCGECMMMWAHMRAHKLQAGDCDGCGLHVMIQYDDNEYNQLKEGRKRVWCVELTEKTG